MATSRTNGRLTAHRDAAATTRRPVLLVIATFVANILAFMLLFQVYKLVRKTFIQRAEVVGFDHAHQIVDIQQRLHIFIEPGLQKWAMSHEWLIRSLNWYYAGFMWGFYLCCLAAMIYSPERYRELRRVFLLTMVLALPWYVIYPLAPPRFMPEYGFFDTLKLYGPNYFKEGGMVTANQFAAMPSMHIGWTTVGAFMLAAAIPYRRIGPTLAVLHVSIMTITVMATGNHYVLDAIGGWMIVGAAFLVARRLPAQFPFPWVNKREPIVPPDIAVPATSSSRAISAR